MEDDKLDPSGMLTVVENFPDQCRHAWKLAGGTRLPAERKIIENILVAGMGGSAIAGDLLRCYLRSVLDKPIFVNREYTLPRWVGRQTMVIASSYSGNTEETLSAYAEACRRNAKILAITTGGKLGDNAAKADQAVLKIPGGLQPRAALGYSFIPLLRLFSTSKWIPSQNQSISGLFDVLDKVRDQCSRDKPVAKNPAKKIAGQLHGTYPIIYSASDPYDAVVTRWRGQLAENAKLLSSGHVLPEMNHNEIVGWEHDPGVWKKMHIVMLRDEEQEHERTALRFKTMQQLIRSKTGSITTIKARGDRLLARMFSLIYLGDFVSVYLARMNRVDPMPVEPIQKLKKVLSAKPFA
jgi:glucose/mannose-6-phosphate isomerase